jgi:hypothetical protein
MSVESRLRARLIAGRILRTLTWYHSFEESHEVLTDPRPEEPLFQLCLYHLRLHIPDLSLLLHFPLVHLLQEGVDTHLAWVVAATNHVLLRLCDIGSELWELVHRVYDRFFVVELLLELQLFIFSLINYLFVPLVNREPISVDWFDYFKRSLVNLSVSLSSLSCLSALWTLSSSTFYCLSIYS